VILAAISSPVQLCIKASSETHKKLNEHPENWKKMLDGWTGGYILAAIFDVVVIHAGLQIPASTFRSRHFR